MTKDREKKRLEDLDLLDVIEFFWNQKWVVFACLVSGAVIGVCLAAFKNPPLKSREISLFLVSDKQENASYGSINPTIMSDFLNSRQGREALYSGAESILDEEGLIQLREMTPDYFRSFIVDIQKIERDRIVVDIILTDNFYFRDLDKAISAGLNKAVETYNNSQAANYSKMIERLYEADKKVNKILIEASRTISSEELTKSGNIKLFEIFNNSQQSHSKFDMISAMINLTPESNLNKTKLEEEAKNAFVEWTLINQDLQNSIAQNKSQIPTPWKKMHIESKKEKLNENIMPFSNLVTARLITGLFFGLIIGIGIGGIREYSRKNAARLSAIFAKDSSQTSTELGAHSRFS